MFYYNLSQTKQRKTNCGTRQSFIICKTRPSNTGRIFSKIEYRLKSPHPAVGVVQILINITTKACEEQQSCDVVIITTVCPLSFKLESNQIDSLCWSIFWLVGANAFGNTGSFESSYRWQGLSSCVHSRSSLTFLTVRPILARLKNPFLSDILPLLLEKL